jgi:serine/threonine-protein kinase
MGVVYEANDAIIDRRVAVKLVRTELLEGQEREDYVERFRREAQAAARCSHPGVVVVFDYALHEGNPYLVMEYVDGLGLDKVLAQGERFAPPAAVHIVAQVLEALGAAHEAGIVHRDIKPANILLAAGARVKVTDFGVARLPSSSLTHHGAAVGTPSYMSPEQCRGAPVDARSDLFSAATVLQEMLTGRRPFGGRDFTEVAVRLLQDPPEGGEAVEAIAGPALRKALEHALAKRPDDRFSSAREMAEALRRAVESEVADETLVENIDRTIVTARGRAPSRSDLPSRPSSTGSMIDPALLGSIERRLAERVGPIAHYLVQTSLRTAASAEELCDALAQRIDRPEARRQFLTEALEALRSGTTAAPAALSTTHPPPSTFHDGSGVIPAEEIERVRRALAESLGPIAKILVQRTVPHATSLQDLWDRLAAHIGEAGPRADFLRRRGTV